MSVFMKSRKAFTLIELLVVVMIIGILVAVGVPKYRKTVETAKATKAVGITQEIARANKLFNVDHGVWISPWGGSWFGSPSQRACTQACPANYNPTANEGDICRLVECGYLNDRDWNAEPYCYRPLAPGTGAISLSWRKMGAAPGTNDAPYASWMYRIRPDESCDTNFTAAPPCPAM